MAERRGYSLAARLALVTSIWSACALSLTGVILTELFQRDAERSFDARIEADLVNLVRAASGRPGAPPSLPAEALGQLFREPFSGWAWQVRQGDAILAQSASLGPLIPGVMEPLRAPDGALGNFIAPGGIASRGKTRPILLTGGGATLSFAVAGPHAEIDGSLAEFSNLLLYSLAVFGAVMFVASLFLTRVLLAPVDLLTEAVRRLRAGDVAALDRRWPRELTPIAGELRGLSTHIERLIERSRNQTSDLAHALKTPLSIMRQSVEQSPDPKSGSLLAQLDRIGQSLDWHLTRRRLAGPRHGRVLVAPIVDDVNFAMQRLFQAKALALSSEVAPDAHFLGDEEDLQEILGNVVENACKWAKSWVSVSASVSDAQLTLRIEDDGPGIPDEVSHEVFRRGARLDEAAPGHGHGLAIVHDIVGAYSGAVEIGTSAAGGAAIRVTLPGAAVEAGV